jgi:outer membrane protein assembly factor BamB
MSWTMEIGASFRPWIACLLSALVVTGCGGGDGSTPSSSTPPPSIALTSLTPNTAVAGSGELVITATGSGYTTASVAKWNGVTLTTNFVSATSLTITVPASDLAAPGSSAVTIVDPTEGDAGSATVQFTISDETSPTIASLAPATLAAGSANFQLTVTGTNFAATATVLWNGSPIPTTYDSATELTAQVSAAKIATPGTIAVTVSNNAAAGGTSGVQNFTVSVAPPAPSLTSVSPATLAAYSTAGLTITGAGFSPLTLVIFNGQVLPSTYVSSTQITVGPTQFNYAVGTIQLYVEDPGSGDRPSNPLQVAITQPVPILSGLTPGSVTAAQPSLPLTVNGQYFTVTSVVYFNGSARPTTPSNQGQLVAQLTAQDVAVAGTAGVTVEDPASGNTPSNSLPFVVQPLPPLTLSSLSPSTVPAGNTAFHLTVLGTGFTPSSAIAFNGTSLITTYVSGTTLTASVSAAQVAGVGTASITVVNPANQGGTSSPRTLSIVAPSIDAVSYQINNAHNGFVSFNSPSFPATASWSVDLGGEPSYSLIVGGTVYVAAAVNGDSELSALNGATGATVWGPIAFAGAIGITYDAGKIFVDSGSYAAQGILTALDATTGNSSWSAAIPGTFATAAPPVASEGLVYTLDDGVLTAFDENTGAQVWQQNVSGTDGAPSATVDGLYVAPVCYAIDLQPATGTTLWTHNTGCEGGGGNTPVVGAGVMYAPLDPGYYSGNVYAAESGQVLGAFSASAPPALSATTAFVIDGSTLQGISLSNNQVLWSFAGDGGLTNAPVVVDNYVFIGSTSGNLYALDATTGANLWTKNLGAPVAGPAAGGNASQGYTGLSAGDGLLIVPAGNTVSAFVLSTHP